MSDEELIPSREARKLLGRGRTSLSRYVQAGKLTPAIRGSGPRGEMFFRREDVDALAAELARSADDTEAVA